MSRFKNMRLDDELDDFIDDDDYDEEGAGEDGNSVIAE